MKIPHNNYLAGGGDGFRVLLEGRGRTQGGSAREALIRYLETEPAKAPTTERRIEAVRGAR